MEIKINIAFYDPRIIDLAISDLGKIASFKCLNQDKNYYILQIDKIDPDYQADFAYEFFNYLLELRQNNREF